MNISVKGIKVKEIQALETYAQKKAEKFNHFFKQISKVEIVLETKTSRKGVEKDFEVTIHVHVPGKTEIVKELANDMYAAIDKGSDRMVEVLRRQKEKTTSRKFRRIRAFRDRVFALLRRRSS